MLMGSSTEAEAVEVKQIGGDDVGEREEMESEEMRGGGREGGREAMVHRSWERHVNRKSSSSSTCLPRFCEAIAESVPVRYLYM